MTVYLVGAGPGDPGLLTLRGAQLLASAEVVVYDRLVDPAVLALADVGAERIDVGKRSGDASSSQARINALLVEKGRVHRVVVRLKGGDPYVFGRGGEEALALEEAGLGYEVVPGVSAVLAAPAYAGVPLTHRALSSSFAVLTGHDPDANASDWDALGRSSATLVVVMGAAHRAAVATRLLQAGRPVTTPVVVVEHATTSRQHTTRTTLEGLKAIEIESPATIVIGEVAALSLAALEHRPLFGASVLLTRARGENDELSRLVRAQGATVRELPARASVPPEDGGRALRGACAHLEDFAWVVFSSRNAVEWTFAELHDARDLGSSRIAAVGPSTARALAEHGIVADLVGEPGDGVGAATAILRSFPDAPLTTDAQRARVLVPRASGGRLELLEGLALRGWLVDAVDAYASVAAGADSALLEDLDVVDAVVLASPSGVDGLLALTKGHPVPRTIVTIGPTTTSHATACGLHVDAEADEPSDAGVMEALLKLLAR